MRPTAPPPTQTERSTVRPAAMSPALSEASATSEASAVMGGAGPSEAAMVVPGPMVPFEESDGRAVAELAAGLAIAVTAAVEDVADTNRDVAQRLHALAGWLHHHGRTADALVPAAAAAARSRGLAAAEPGLRFMLAEATALLSRLHSALDDLDAATRAAAESVRNLRALAALEPDEYRLRLAEQLLDLGELLMADARPGVALESLQEGMSVAAEHDTSTQARARHLLGLCLDRLDRPADGLAQLEIAAELYGVLSQEDDGYLLHRAEVRASPHSRPPAWPATPHRTHALDATPHWMQALVATPPEQAVSRAARLLEECRAAVESAVEPRAADVHAYVSAQAGLARAWADAGRAEDGFALAMQAAELLQRHAVSDRSHAVAVGRVAAALGRTLMGLGRHKEAVPHLLTAIESYEPRPGASRESGAELAELLILNTVALSRAACSSEAEAAADRLVGLYAALVSERLETPLPLAGALLLQGCIRFTRQNVEGALISATRALEIMPDEPPEPGRLLTATCLELSGLCLAELHDDDAARAKLTEGTELPVERGPAHSDLVNVHVLALARLARLRVREEGPAAAIPLHARLLRLRPLPAPDVLTTLIEELDAALDDPPGALLPPLTDFTEALERTVPLSTGAEVHERYGRYLARFASTAARAGDTIGPREGPAGTPTVREGDTGAPEVSVGDAGAPTVGKGDAGTPEVRVGVAAGGLAVQVYRGLVTVSGTYRDRLGLALAALGRLDPTDLVVLEQAVILLGAQIGDRPAVDERGRVLAETLSRYAVELLERGRAVEALAHCERAADLCDELDDPAVAAVTYARLGSSLAVLDRPQAALEAVTWSLAELERARERGQELPHARAQAIQVRGQVLRAFGRKREAMAHLVEALEIYTRLAQPAAAAEVAGVIADDLLAGGRAEDAAEYARIAATGQPAGTVRHALAVQRLARCHLMLGELTAADTLVERLIPLARRSPDDLTYRAILADSLAQSSELRTLLGLGDGAEAEARAREAIAMYDDLLTTGMNAEALHISRAGAGLTLAAALGTRGLAEDAVGPLREAVAALERYAPGNPALSGLLGRGMLMLGDALMESGRALEASLVFHRGTQVTRDVPARAVAHARLGFCQQELGRDDAADAALRVSAGLLRGLVADSADDGFADLLRDVLRGRLALLRKAGAGDETKPLEDELRRLTAR
ncbi:hypothetical protein ITP53_14525 [Nonomuraea sp. K274]|uniref:Tetratricopeptide repeat protein n=1 Tax=Nonomuraea cypriaca TaxID=1187855 RepID=A0A931AAB0_9ACTN|nr:hypothetical protein [Nonomuraea cypriaca]MBF8186933.1 hypothetical protein [Nonomuraea cypriaca]